MDRQGRQPALWVAADERQIAGITVMVAGDGIGACVAAAAMAATH
jgi:hypothetical protein